MYIHQITSAFILVFALTVYSLRAQVSGAPCTLATVINDNNDCIAIGSVDLNTNSLSDGFPLGCSEPSLSKWFQFVPSNSFISIYLENIEPNNKSPITLSVFQTDNCEDDFIEVFCGVSENKNWLHVELPYVKIGRKYLVQVGRLQEEEGELKFCINSYYPFKVPGNTCESASIICDDEPKILVPGIENNYNVPVFSNHCDSELLSYNESWYKWRVDSDGKMAFTLRPFLSSNNIDFAFYKILDGIEGCNLELIRCESVLNSEGSNCGQETGLKEGSSVEFLNMDCEDWNSSFLAPINVLKGESYALQVFSTNENAGHVLKFNNSAEIYDPVGLGFGTVLSQVGECTYRRKYTSNGNDNYKWDIGPFSLADGPLLGNEIYILTDSLGTSNVQVSSETFFGCILTEVDSLCLMERLSITSFFDLKIDSIKGIECGQIDGSYLKIFMDVRCDDYNGFEYSIDGGPFTTETTYRDLSLGEHEIRVRLDESCEISRTVLIEEEVNFNGIIQGNLIDSETCLKEYEFSIDLTGELSGNETVFWDFGPDASPRNAEGIGPHLIQIKGFGVKDIRALIREETECFKEIPYVLDIPICNKDISPEIIIVDNSKADCNDENGRIEIEIEGGCGPFLYYLDEEEIDSSSIDNLSSGSYTFKIIDIDSCVIIKEFNIDQEEELFINAGPDITSNLLGEVYDFDLEYNYNDISISTNSTNIKCRDETNCLKPSLLINGPESIVFIAENSIGCSAYDTVNVTVDFDPESILFIPNIFSPNDDGVNDKFEIYFPDVYSVKIEQFEVFDRWGNKVYNLIDRDEHINSISLWDGKTLGTKKSGTAIYVFVGTFIVSQGSIEKEVSISRSITMVN